jgi:phosphoribosylformylglycinamidine synthase
VKIAFRNAGDVIVLLDGVSSPNRHSEQSEESALRSTAQQFSSSEYSKTVGGIVAGEPPAIDLAAEKRLIDCLVSLASDEAVVSAHDISDGGLAVTLAECSFPVGAPHVYPGPLGAVPALGADAKLPEGSPAENALFGERGARCMVSVPPAKLAALQAIARQYNVAANSIGQVTSSGSLRIEYKGRAVVDSPVEDLRDIWANSLERTLQSK